MERIKEDGLPQRTQREKREDAENDEARAKKTDRRLDKTEVLA
jgi:hypothetical protein